jgi:hypothetical protein
MHLGAGVVKGGGVGVVTSTPRGMFVQVDQAILAQKPCGVCVECCPFCACCCLWCFGGARLQLH